MVARAAAAEAVVVVASDGLGLPVGSTVIRWMLRCQVVNPGGQPPSHPQFHTGLAVGNKFGVYMFHPETSCCLQMLQIQEAKRPSNDSQNLTAQPVSAKVGNPARLGDFPLGSLAVEASVVPPVEVA